MDAFVVYDVGTGAIKRQGFCPKDALARQPVADGEALLVADDAMGVSPFTHEVVDGKLRQRAVALERPGIPAAEGPSLAERVAAFERRLSAIESRLAGPAR